MKKHKLLLIWLSALFVAALIYPAFADETVDETAPFQYTIGAQMRFLQLQKSIEKNILWGEYIINTIEEKNSSIDTTNLESILAELIALKEEVEGINITDANNSSEVAQTYLDIKEEAIELTKEFREEARKLINPGDIQGIKKQLGERYRLWEANQTNRIRNRICEYNAERIGRIFSNANISHPTLIEQIRNCNASKHEIAGTLKNVNLSREQRHQLKFSLKEAGVKSQVFTRAVMDKIRYNHLERKQNRLEHRLEHMYNLNYSAGIVNRIQLRMNLSNKTMERIQNRTEKRIAFIGNWTEKKVAYWTDLQGRILNISERQIVRIEARLNNTNLTDKQKGNLERQRERIEERTEKIVQGIEDKINRTEEHGQRIIGNLEKTGNGSGKKGGN